MIRKERIYLVLGQYRVVLVGSWWYLVTIVWYWLIYYANGSAGGCNGWYLVVLGQYNLVLIGIKW